MTTTNFIKNVVLDNILPGDIYAKARELHFDSDVQPRRPACPRRPPANDISALRRRPVASSRTSRRTSSSTSARRTLSWSRRSRAASTASDIEKLARIHRGHPAGSEPLHHSVVVGIGTPIGSIKDLASKSFKEAQYRYGGRQGVRHRDVRSSATINLGIARLIYQLPTTLCEMFLERGLQAGARSTASTTETLFTIQRFFENNLNVSETSREPVRTPKHPGLPPGEDPQADRPGSAQLR